jgi:two-component system sensor histidine kinase BarA
MSNKEKMKNNSKQKQNIKYDWSRKKMSDMDGIEAFQKIREKDKKIPVIAHTAHILGNKKRELLETGFNDYLAKPVSKNQLLIIIDKWLNYKQRPDLSQKSV